MFDVFLETFLSNLPLRLQKFIEYPGALERVELAITNIPLLFVCFICLVGVYFILPRPNRVRFLKSIAILAILITVVIRSFWDYAYDTPFALICQISDMAALLYLVYRVGKLLHKHNDISLRISLGISIFTIVSVIFIFLRINYLLAVPNYLFHIIFSFWLVFEIWKSDVKPESIFNLEFLLIVLVTCLPFIPFLFSPAPPDADILTQSEIIGYLYQGQPLWHVDTGVVGEWFSVRYPAGFAGLGWILSHFINVRASEVMLLLSIMAYLLIIINLLSLAQELHLNRYVVLLFALNPTITGTLGIRGGQVQEMVSYGLGISMVSLLFKKQFNSGAICLAAATIIHPVVSLPFWGVITIWKIVTLIKQPRSFHWIGIVVLILSLIYLGTLHFGEKLYVSVPVTMLSKVTLQVFLSNAYGYLQSDNFGLQYFIITIVIGLFVYKKQSYKYLYLLIWLAGAFIIDGVFGVHYGGRAHANFSSIAIWILSICVTYDLLTRYLPRIQKVKTVVFGLFVGIWIIHVTPNFLFFPCSVFTTHSDVRMGRYIEQNLSKDVLIANIRPPGDIGITHGLGFMMRGNSSRHTVFARMKEHQIKNGKIREVSFEYCTRLLSPKSFPCLKELGTTHIVIDARPGTEIFVNSLEIKPIKQFGQTYLFSLDTL
jgi:hypothetical protein